MRVLNFSESGIENRLSFRTLNCNESFFRLAKMERELKISFCLKSLTAQLREIGKLEAKFEKTATPSKKEPVAKKSNAPAPISPIKASSSAVETGLDSDRAFHGTYQQWKAARLAGKIR